MDAMAVKAFIISFLELGDLEDSAAMGKVRGWDSLKHIQLFLALESHFNIFIEPDLFGELQSVGQITNHIVNGTAPV